MISDIKTELEFQAISKNIIIGPKSTDLGNPNIIPKDLGNITINNQPVHYSYLLCSTIVYYLTHIYKFLMNKLYITNFIFTILLKEYRFKTYRFLLLKKLYIKIPKLTNDICFKAYMLLNFLMGIITCYIL